MMGVTAPGAQGVRPQSPPSRMPEIQLSWFFPLSFILIDFILFSFHFDFLFLFDFDQFDFDFDSDFT